MGRSQLTITNKMDRLERVQLKNYKRALYSLNQRRAFDELFAYARNNRMAMSQAVDMLPVDVALVTMVIELKLEVQRLEREIGELRKEKSPD